MDNLSSQEAVTKKESAPQKWRRFRLFVNFLQQTFGIYTFEAEESAQFNATIAPSYRRLQADFKRLCDEGDKYLCKKDIVKKLDDLFATTAPGTATRSDLYVMESYLLAIATNEYIEQAYPSLQDRYKALAGATAFDRYKSSRAKDTDTDPDKKRADAQVLIGELRRLAIAIPRREALRSYLVLNVLGWGAIAAFVEGGFIAFYPWWHHFPYLLVVSFMSLFGGTISVMRRIQATPDEELNLAQWGRVGLVLSPYTSMGFGIVLYYILASNFGAPLITTTLFPDLTKIESACPCCCISAHCPDAAVPDAQLASTQPSAGGAVPTATSAESPRKCPGCTIDGSNCLAKSAFKLSKDGGNVAEWIKTFDFQQFAKLLVWAFIAGFAEQFVPDTLDALIKRQAATGAKTGDVK